MAAIGLGTGLVGAQIGYASLARPGHSASMPSPDNLDALLIDLARAQTHGTRDDAKPVSQLAGMDAIQATCGPASDWAQAKLREAGYVTRRVAFITLEDWNGLDDGHQAVEVWHPRLAGWVVFDPTMDRVFEQTAYSMVFVRHAPVGLSTRPAVAPKFDQTTSLAFSDPQRWYARMCQVALIFGGDGFYFNPALYSAETVRRIMSYAPGWYKPDKRFLERFYNPVGVA